MKKSKLFIFLMVLVISLTSVAFADTLKQGSQGAKVSKLQKELKKLGYFSGSITGYYGSQTKAAVKKFQAKSGISAIGIVGPQTTKALYGYGTSSRGGSTASGSKTSRAEAVKAEKEADAAVAADTNVTVDADAEADKQDDAIAGEDKEKSLAEEDSMEEAAESDIKGKIEVLDWWTQANKVFSIGTTAKVIDVRTGKSFNIKRTYGGNHADSEALTKADTKTIKEIWGGSFSWARRPVIVVVNGRYLAASMAGMPHAGLDNKPTNAVVNGRSEGYGRGVNLDAVKNNGMDGHFDIHFKNSRTHGTNRVDAAHQKAIKEAAAAKL